MKKVSEFLQEVKEKKVEQLMSIALDKEFWTRVIGKDDEDKLRKELETENQKRTLDKKGVVLADKRDMDKISRLSKRIDELARAHQEIEKLTDMQKSIQFYFDYVNDPGKETMKLLEAISTLK